MSVGFSKFVRTASKLMRPGFVQTRQQVRNGGDGPPKMSIVPTRWYDLEFKELFSFYLTVCAAPLVAISLYSNIFIGTASLKPIPEGYEPREEEYERHPITRWFMRNVFEEGQMLYETKLHAIYDGWAHTHREMLISEVKRVMASDGDYADWTYTVGEAKYARFSRSEYEEKKESSGSFR